MPDDDPADSAAELLEALAGLLDTFPAIPTWQREELYDTVRLVLLAQTLPAGSVAHLESDDRRRLAAAFQLLSLTK